MSGVARIAGILLIIALAFGVVGAPLICEAPCIIDFDATFAPDPSAHDLRATDTRLNVWILWWVQTAILSGPASLFDGNVFWPASGVLVGSEHMLTLAVLTLPLRLFTDDAVLVYHVAMLLTFVIAGLATEAFVRWLTGDAVAALLAAALAMLMPWRIEELVHLQLLAAGFIPLIWLLSARALDARGGFGTVVLLTLAWAAQLFASYYLAYFAIFSTSAFLVVYALLARSGVRGLLSGLLRALVPLLVSAGALAAVSLPYLAQQGAEEVALRGTSIVRSLAPSWVFGQLAPSFTLGDGTPWAHGYELPLVVLVLGAFGIAAARERKQRAAVLAVLFAAAVALLMSFGEALDLGGTIVPLPAGFAAAHVPGFANLRAPLRWTLVLGVALPLLAGLGIAALRSAIRLRNGGFAASMATAVVALLAAIELAPPGLATAPVSPGFAAELPGLHELSALDEGPVLDLPWPQNLSANAHVASEHMVASTVHGKPILAGYTAYFPRHYDFLLRASRRLPDARVLHDLARATGLRWIVLHHAMLAPGEREAWEQAAPNVPLIAALRDEALTVYELPDSALDPIVKARLLAPAPDAPTFLALSRKALTLERDSGSFTAAIPKNAPLYGPTWTKLPVPVAIENDSTFPWPALDPEREGLLLVRYRIVDAAGKALVEGLADLDADIAPRSTLATYVVVEGHVGPGTHRFELSLVQKLGATETLLPFPPVTASVAMVSATP